MTSLETLVKYVDDYENYTRDSRQKAERDRDYYDHKQLSEAQIAEYKKRDQPPIIRNRIKPKVDFLLGQERQLRVEPKALPRTPAHEEDAFGATDALRYVTDNNNYDSVRSSYAKNMFIEGTGCVEIGAKAGKNGIEVAVKYHEWDRIIHDPFSRREDYSDSKYKGLYVWMDRDDAIQFAETNGGPKNSAKIIDEALASSDGQNSESGDDAPRNQWGDRKHNRVKMVQLYFMDKGVWMYSLFTKSGFISEPIESPYIDEDGDPQCPLELQSAYVDRENARYGVVRVLIDLQDEINARASKMLHLMNSRQTWAVRGAIDVAEFKRNIKKPNGHFEIREGSEFGRHFGIMPTGDMYAGNVDLLQLTIQEIDDIGANASLSGKEDRNLSGRALLARQQSGQTELGPVFDGIRMMDQRVFRQCWSRIRQFWDQERWIRVTDDERNMKWVGFNQPVTVGDQMLEEFGEIPAEFQNDPRLQQKIGVKNELSKMDIDLIIEDAPDTTIIQSEQSELITRLYEANPNSIPFEAVIESLPDLRNKEKVIELIRGNEEAQQANAAKAQQAEQLQLAAATAEIEKTTSEAAKNMAAAEKNQSEAIKTQADLGVI